MLAKQGLNTKALAVKERPKAAKPAVVRDVADVAPRTRHQQAWADTVANGASAGKNWVTVGAMPYTEPFLLSAEVERQRLEKQTADQKSTSKLAGFLKLQGEAQAIESSRSSTGKGYGDLNAREVATLVRYEYAARDAKGASKVTSKPACVTYLDSLTSGALSTALESPLLLQGKDLEPARLLLKAPSSGFGDVGITLPDGLIPLPAPSWLENALDPSRPESGQLAGRPILFNWAGSGWAVGELGQPNTNKRYRVEGATANFRAKYASDGSTASHVLSLTGYAADSGADEDSWVLLGPPAAAPLQLTATTPAPLGPPRSSWCQGWGLGV